MSANVIRTTFFTLARACLRGASRRERAAAREAMVRLACASPETMESAAASDFAGSTLGIGLMWDDAAAGYIREARPTLRPRGPAAVLTLPPRDDLTARERA